MTRSNVVEDFKEGLKKIGVYLLMVLLCWLVAGVLLVCSFVPVLNKKFLQGLRKVLW